MSPSDVLLEWALQSRQYPGAAHQIGQLKIIYKRIIYSLKSIIYKNLEKYPPPTNQFIPKDSQNLNPYHLSLPSPIRTPHILNPSNLIIRKPRIARISRVIHRIVNRVRARVIRTAILDRRRRTSICADALRRGIVNKVTIAIARVALKGVQQTQPMPRLMRRRHALIIPIDRALGHRARIDIAAISHIAGRVGDVGGQRAGAEDAAIQVRLEVDVERIVGALAQRILHVRVVRPGAHGPGVVGGEVGAFEVELHADGLVGGVECRDLCVRHVLRDGAGRGGLGHDVEVGVDGDGEAALGELRTLASTWCALWSVFAVESGDGGNEMV